MPQISRNSRIFITLFLLAVVGAAAFYRYSTPMPGVLFNLPTMVYAVLVLAWEVTASRRILHQRVRDCMVAGASFLVVMFVLRMVRWSVGGPQTEMSRLLWYAYYIPQTAVPLLSLSSALFVGTKVDDPVPRILRILVPVCILIDALILTNDLHGWMFLFAKGGGYVSYRYGTLYLVSVVWIVVLTLSSIAVLIQRCRISATRSLWFVPLLAAVPGLVLLVWYNANGGNAPIVAGKKLYNFQEAFAILFIFMWESCIQLGLIPTNTDYTQIFEQSPVSAFITARDGRLLYRTAKAVIPSREKQMEAQTGPVAVDRDHVLFSHAVRKGIVYWTDDISSVNAANRKIADAIEYLEDENSLLEEEARIKSERAAYEVQNRIYDSILPVVQPQLAEISRLLTEDPKTARQSADANPLQPAEGGKSDAMMPAEGGKSDSMMPAEGGKSDSEMSAEAWKIDSETVAAVKNTAVATTVADGDFADRLTKSMVLAAYVKRRLNLALLTDAADHLPAKELELAIRETLEYLRLRGVVCALETVPAAVDLTDSAVKAPAASMPMDSAVKAPAASIPTDSAVNVPAAVDLTNSMEKVPSAAFPAAQLILAYDFFEASLEQGMPGMDALYAVLRTQGTLRLDLQIHAASDVLPQDWHWAQCEKPGARLAFETDEDAVLARISFETSDTVKTGGAL